MAIFSADSCRSFPRSPFWGCAPRPCGRWPGSLSLPRRERDPAACLAAVEAVLPYVDNWATCDQLSPPALGKRPEALMERIPVWLKSGHVYTVRFGLGMLQRWFLEDAFAPRFLDWAGQDLGEAY